MWGKIEKPVGFGLSGYHVTAGIWSFQAGAISGGAVSLPEAVLVFI